MSKTITTIESGLTIIVPIIGTLCIVALACFVFIVLILNEMLNQIPKVYRQTKEQAKQLQSELSNLIDINTK